MYETGFDLAHTTGSRQVAFAPKVPQSEQPAGPGVHDLYRVAKLNGIGQVGWIEVQPFGTPRAGLTFLMRLWGWTATRGGKSFSPTYLAEARVTLGDISGRAYDKQYGLKGSLLASCVELTQPFETAHVVNGPEGVPAILRVDCASCHLLEFEYARNGRPKAELASGVWKALGHPIEDAR